MTTGSEASSEVEIVALVEVEIVALVADYPETEYQTSSEFNNKIIRDWNGTKKVLQGNTLVKLNEGILSVMDLRERQRRKLQKTRSIIR